MRSARALQRAACARRAGSRSCRRSRPRAPSTLSAPRSLPAGEPARDALEARPPERARLREILDCRGNARGRWRAVRATGSSGSAPREGLGELAERAVDDAAAVGRARREVDGVKLAQPQDVPGIDGVGIAQPVLDVGDREGERSRARAAAAASGLAIGADGCRAGRARAPKLT